MRGIYDTITCDSIDGDGCGCSWLEGDKLFRLACPRCGRAVTNGNVIVNDEGTPDVWKLDDPFVLVPFEEKPE